MINEKTTDQKAYIVKLEDIHTYEIVVQATDEEDASEKAVDLWNEVRPKPDNVEIFNIQAEEIKAAKDTFAKNTNYYIAYLEFEIGEEYEEAHGKVDHDGIIEKCQNCSISIFYSAILNGAEHWHCAKCNTPLRSFGHIRSEFDGHAYYFVATSNSVPTSYNLHASPLGCDGIFSLEESLPVKEFTVSLPESYHEFIITQLQRELKLSKAARQLPYERYQELERIFPEPDDDPNEK